MENIHINWLEVQKLLMQTTHIAKVEHYKLPQIIYFKMMPVNKQMESVNDGYLKYSSRL